MDQTTDDIYEPVNVWYDSFPGSNIQWHNIWNALQGYHMEF